MGCIGTCTYNYTPSGTTYTHRNTFDIIIDEACWYGWTSVTTEEPPINLYYCNGRTFTNYDSYRNHKIMMERIRHPKDFKFQSNFRYSKKQNKKRHLQLKGNWVK